MNENSNNGAFISGAVYGFPVYSHSVYGEKFYTFDIEVERTSGNVDLLSVIASERTTDIDALCPGDIVSVRGEIRSYNLKCAEKTRLVLNVFARSVQMVEHVEADENGSNNSIYLDGYICKPPTYRETPMCRELSDAIVAVNRAYGKSDYIPCIFWGRNARFASQLPVGSHVSLSGRFQSREYRKNIGDVTEIRTAFEVSVGSLEVIENEN